MITSLFGRQKSVLIDTDGPIVIGEKINPTGYKKLATALQEQDFEYIRQLATKQVSAGADVLDINVGVPGLDESAMLPKVVELIAEITDVPVCLDSPNPAALAAALPVAPGKPLVNSVSGEKSRLEKILPLVKKYDVPVVAISNDETGISALYDAARMLGARRRQEIMEVGFFASAPAIFAGLQISLSIAWSCVLAAELVGSRSGMGFIIILGMNQSSPALIIAGMAVIAITACLISVVMNRLENIICPWKRELPQ